VFHFYFRLAWLGQVSLESYVSWWLNLPFTLRGTRKG
jgi:hypothetical protein